MDQVPSVEDAIALAARAHRGQRYPSPEREPYIFHPLRVMLLVREPADQIVAVLHDVVEDTDVELRDLVSASYPAEIVAAVDALSHRAGESYDEYIERVAANEIACRVKIADLRENLANNLRLPTSPGNAERIARYQTALTRLASSRGARRTQAGVRGSQRHDRPQATARRSRPTSKASSLDVAHTLTDSVRRITYLPDVSLRPVAGCWFRVDARRSRLVATPERSGHPSPDVTYGPDGRA